MQLSSPSVTRLPMKFSSQQSPPCQTFSGATSKRSMNSLLAPGVSCAAVDTATQTRSCDSPTPQKGDKPMGWTTHAQKPTLLLLLHEKVVAISFQAGMNFKTDMKVCLRVPSKKGKHAIFVKRVKFQTT